MVNITNKPKKMKLVFLVSDGNCHRIFATEALALEFIKINNSGKMYRNYIQTEII